MLMHFRAGRKNQNTVSIQDSIEGEKENGGLTINDVVADTFLMDEAYEIKEETQKLYDVLQTLDGRERQIVILRYGLQGTMPLTQQQVADVLHISRSYVSRIEKKALSELKRELEKV